MGTLKGPMLNEGAGREGVPPEAQESPPVHILNTLLIETRDLSWKWWHTPAISAFGRLRQEDHQEFEASLDLKKVPGQPGIHSETKKQNKTKPSQASKQTNKNPQTHQEAAFHSCTVLWGFYHHT